MNAWTLPGIGFFFGALFGSFANVVIYRMPLGQSIVWPGSHCRSCKKPLRFYHNIPIFSWIFLRGRCAFCSERIAWRYPLVELVMAFLFATTLWRYGLTWAGLEILVFVFMLVCASFIDLDHMILPDKITLPGIVLGLLGALILPDTARTFVSSLLGVLFGGGFLWAIAALYFFLRKQEGMGGGDIKLLAWIGAVLGFQSLPFVILISSIMGSVVGLALMLPKKKGLQNAIPFGPYLAFAALAFALLNGPSWTAWYLRLHGFEP